MKNSDNFIVVGAKDISVANYGSIIDVYENGMLIGTPVLSGTSQSTAVVTGKIVSGKIKKRGNIIIRGKDGSN